MIVSILPISLLLVKAASGTLFLKRVDADCEPGSSWFDSDFEYLCYQKGSTFEYKPIACIAEDGTHLQSGQSYSSKYYVYLCTVNDNAKTAIYKPVACIAGNGTHLQFGRSYSSEYYIYLCTFDKTAQIAVYKPVACIAGNGTRLQTGQTYYSWNYVYLCTVSETALTAIYKPVACIAENRTHLLSGQIYVNNFFEYLCTVNDTTYSAVYQTVACYSLGGTRMIVGTTELTEIDWTCYCITSNGNATLFYCYSNTAATPTIITATSTIATTAKTGNKSTTVKSIPIKKSSKKPHRSQSGVLHKCERPVESAQTTIRTNQGKKLSD